jgi:hypothetical protein
MAPANRDIKKAGTIDHEQDGEQKFLVRPPDNDLFVRTGNRSSMRAASASALKCGCKNSSTCATSSPSGARATKA